VTVQSARGAMMTRSDAGFVGCGLQAGAAGVRRVAATVDAWAMWLTPEEETGRVSMPR
jgi:hypothetical protein